jgi:acyl-CoA synthetase (AMP-forming)/AMP-acid ligase II
VAVSGSALPGGLATRIRIVDGRIPVSNGMLFEGYTGRDASGRTEAGTGDLGARFSVPREVVFLDELPRNATGTVLNRELPRNF